MPSSRWAHRAFPERAKQSRPPHLPRLRAQLPLGERWALRERSRDRCGVRDSPVDGVSRPPVRARSRGTCGSCHLGARRAWLPNSSGRYWAILNLGTSCPTIRTGQQMTSRTRSRRGGTFSEFLMSSGKLGNHSVILCPEKEWILAVLTSRLKLSPSARVCGR